MSARSPRDEKAYRIYMEFFETAERSRRWSVYNDIPWEELDPSRVDARLAWGAETFCAVEMYLPDYLSHGIQMVRDCFGHAWFQANWGYEESKHSLALREYLVRSGQRTQEQFRAFESDVFSRRWEPPFRTARQMTCYGALQESITLLMYRKQRAVADLAGDTVLRTIYSLISRDEAAHAGFYQNILEIDLDEDRAGTLTDLATVFAGFRMPADDLVPDYEARVAYLREAGVNRSVFLKDVWFQLLHRLGTSRQEVVAHDLRHADSQRAR